MTGTVSLDTHPGAWAYAPMVRVGMMLAARRQAIMVIGAFLLPIIVIAVVQVANGYRQERQAVE